MDVLQELLSPEGVIDPRYLAARRSFWAYCQLVNPKFFRPERIYLHELADTLQALYEGTLLNPETGERYLKLMLNMPPRHGKSYILTLFTQWVLGRNNEMRIITVSYNEVLAGRFARNVRDGISATKVDNNLSIFADVFPGTRIKYGDSAMQMWALEGQYFNYLAAGFGGTITGVGCSIGIIDDPIKNDQEAFNDAVLEAQWAWYCDTFLSRVEEGGLQILNMTRWSTKDLCGRILDSEEAGEWYVFRRPAYNEATGQMLCEQLLSLRSYQRKRRLTSDAIADANYQQQPVDIKGKLYTKFATYQDIPRDPAGRSLLERVVAYVDTADTGADYLCALVAGEYRGELWMLDVYYTDEPMEVTEPATAELLYRNSCTQAWIESNNGGRGFARNVERLLYDTHGSRRTRVEWFCQSANKQARILSGSTYVMDHIYMPEDWATRWPKYHKDMTTYQRTGKNKHDDAPDATTGLGERLTTGPGEFTIY